MRALFFCTEISLQSFKTLFRNQDFPIRVSTLLESNKKKIPFLGLHTLFQEFRTSVLFFFFFQPQIPIRVIHPFLKLPLSLLDLSTLLESNSRFRTFRPLSRKREKKKEKNSFSRVTPFLGITRFLPCCGFQSASPIPLLITKCNGEDNKET